MRRLAFPLAAFPLVAFALAGCHASASRPAAPTQEATKAREASVVPPLDFARAVEPPHDRDPLHEGVPLSLRRILREQHLEIHDLLALTAPIGDPRGRARATGEAAALASELGVIENALAVPGADSERYDRTVVKLLLLQTRVELLHEALRGAVSSNTAVQVEPSVVPLR